MINKRREKGIREVEGTEVDRKGKLQKEKTANETQEGMERGRKEITEKRGRKEEKMGIPETT